MTCLNDGLRGGIDFLNSTAILVAPAQQHPQCWKTWLQEAETAPEERLVP